MPAPIIGTPANRQCAASLMTHKTPGETHIHPDPADTNEHPGMHRPGHNVLDTVETSELDELQREDALRNSILRTPR